VNLSIPLVSNFTKIPFWNRRGKDYIVSIFNFTDKFLTPDGALLLFHPYDPYNLKEIKSYFKSYVNEIGRLHCFWDLQGVTNRNRSLDNWGLNFEFLLNFVWLFMLMVTCGLPKNGSFGKVKNICRHTILE
jgi:hypothetical protein